MQNVGTLSQHICRLPPVGIFPSKRGKPYSWIALLGEIFTLPLPCMSGVSAQWTAAASYFCRSASSFAFSFSSCKWKLALRTADLNVLRQEDLSFVPMKLIEISFMWWVFSSLFHCSCPFGINLSWPLWEEKDFYSNAISRVLLSRPTKPVQWGYIVTVLDCLMQNILQNSKSSVLHTVKAVIFH